MASETTERNRQAAEHALQQLDRCVRFLHGIGKKQIPSQTAKKRNYVKPTVVRAD